MNAVTDEAIVGLDLEHVKRKLMQGKPGSAWSRERVEAAEKEYRRFLFLMKLFPHELAAPSMDVDRFWHHHIIDTAKYACDCEAVFGYFLHRYPYLGLGPEDESVRLKAGTRMRELYRELFPSQGNRSDADAAPTGFAMAVQSSSQTRLRGPSAIWVAPGDADAPNAADESREPGRAEDVSDDLLDQVRFVVIENQRYDRVAEPVM